MTPAEIDTLTTLLWRAEGAMEALGDETSRTSRFAGLILPRIERAADAAGTARIALSELRSILRAAANEERASAADEAAAAERELEEAGR
jgi:hypothetical protein